jgi:hypothetical protein
LAIKLPESALLDSSVILGLRVIEWVNFTTYTPLCRNLSSMSPLWKMPFSLPLFGILFLSLDRQRGVRGDFLKNMSTQLWTP